MLSLEPGIKKNFIQRGNKNNQLLLFNQLIKPPLGGLGAINI
jgi:hypothetical protein